MRKVVLRVSINFYENETELVHHYSKNIPHMHYLKSLIKKDMMQKNDKVITLLQEQFEELNTIKNAIYELQTNNIQSQEIIKKKGGNDSEKAEKYFATKLLNQFN